MKRLFILWAAVLALALTLSVSAMGTPSSPSSAGSEPGMAEEMVPDNSGIPDAGNNARTGDIESNGGARDGSAGGTINGSDSGTSNGSESGTSDTGTVSGTAPSEDNSMIPAPGDQDSGGVSWFAVILSIVIVGAVAALVVALLPRRDRM